MLKHQMLQFVNSFLNYNYMPKRVLIGFMQDFNAKLSDFGLARDGPTGDNTHVSTRVVGTRGYAAPEYVATGHCCLLIALHNIFTLDP